MEEIALVEREIHESILVKKELAEKSARQIAQIGGVIVERFKAGKKILVFGNGGSAADAQHIAAEFVGRYQTERRALPAIALTTDTSTLTALSNDYGFDCVFARQIEALANSGDVALAISTSGNSPNVLRALETAKRLGLLAIGLTGKTGGGMKTLADLCICVPSDSTPRIQEAHILIGHILSSLVERAFLPEYTAAHHSHSTTTAR